MSRNKYPEETVTRILDAAEALFLEKGYEKTTIQDVVDRLGGMTKGAVYHHFKSKEEIFLAVGNRIFDRQGDNGAYWKAYTSAMPADRKLGALIAAVFDDEAETKFRSICPNLQKTPQFLLKMLNNCVESSFPAEISQVIRQGISEQKIKTDYPDELAQLLIMTVNLWLNPFIFSADDAKFTKKLGFFDELMGKFGIPPLREILEPAVFARFAALNRDAQAPNERLENGCSAEV